MTKKTVVKPYDVGDNFLKDMTDEKVSLSEFKERLDFVFEHCSAPDNVFFEAITRWYGDDRTTEWVWTYERKETDEEYDSRLATEKVEQEAYKQRRMKQLEAEMAAIKASMKGETD